MNEPLLRLFFALPCPIETASRISDWRASFPAQGTPVHNSNLHVTLVFLGAQAVNNLPRLMLLADSIESPSFELTLDRLELWPDGLLHLAPSHTPAALMELAIQLREKLQDAGFEIEHRQYLPHLTLARQSQLPETYEQPTFNFKSNQFCLFASERHQHGLHYRALGCWPLQQNIQTN